MSVHQSTPTGLASAGSRRRLALQALACAGLALAASGARLDAPADAQDAPAAAAARSTGDARAAMVNAPHVARLELAAPRVRDFVLRATIPVPRGTFPRADGQSPLAVADEDGTLVPTQVEPVTWYPGAPLEADVVEVIAKVHRPAGAQPGDRISYDVFLLPHPANFPLRTGNRVLPLLQTTGSLYVRARDVFGNEYVANLIRGRDGNLTMRNGQNAREVRYYEVMRPQSGNVGPPNGPLPHLFGVHSYVGAWAEEDVLTLDVRFNNGPSGYDTANELDNPLGKVYFESLELVVPQGWKLFQQFPDPLFGQPYNEPGHRVYPIVRARPDGLMHVIPAQGMFHRRFVLTPNGNEQRARAYLARENVAFNRQGTSLTGGELWSWWNPATARYFPQRQRLPELGWIAQNTMRNKLRNDLQAAESVMASGGSTGNYPFFANQLGYAHPWGVKHGGMASGTEIYLYDGVVTAAAAAQEGYLYSEIVHRMYTDRHPVALYDMDGSPTRLEQWIVGGPSNQHVNMSFFLVPISGQDPFGYQHAPVYQVNHVEQNGLTPPYETNLLQHAPIDLQHYTRYTNNPKVLVWLGNDSLARDDLRLSAELVRLSYHDLPNSPGGYVLPSGMLADLNFVGNNPGIGFAFGRQEGWQIDTMCAAYSLNAQAWRDTTRPWFTQIVDLLERGQGACSGIIQSQVNSHWFNSQYRGRQSIEQAIVENALKGMCASVYGDAHPVLRLRTEQVLLRSLRSMITAPAWTGNGPRAVMAVAPVPLSQPPFCDHIPPGGSEQGLDTYQTWSSFAYGYELTGDATYLVRAREMAGGTELLPFFESFNFNNLENRAATIALVEELAGP